MRVICKHPTVFKTLLSTSTIQPFEAIPGPKPLPLVGNIWRYLPVIGDYSINKLFDNAKFNRKNYGSIVREKITNNHTVLHLFDPDDIKDFLTLESSLPHRRSHRALLKYRRDRPHKFNNGGLFPENGLEWKKQRNLFNKRLMSLEYVQSKQYLIQDASQFFIDRLLSCKTSNDANFDVENLQEHLSDWALECALVIFTNTGLTKGLSEDKFISIKTNLNDSLAAIDATELTSSKWETTPHKCDHYQKLINSQDRIYEFVNEMIENISPNVVAGNAGSFLNDWITEDSIDRKDVISMIADCLLAGVHTVSYSMAFSLKYLSVHRDFQTKLREDISLDWRKSRLLDYALKETMRLSPVAIGNGRVVTRDDMVIANFHIPKNTMVILHTQLASLDEEVFQKPNDFIPERWSSEQLDQCPHLKIKQRFACMPYGHGSRMCIGHRIANLQMKILITNILKNFEVVHVQDFHTKSALIHSIDSNMKLTFKRLNA